MASDLDDIIVENITIQDSVPDAPSFDMAMFVCYHTAWPDLSREYSKAGDLLTDGFLVTDDAYLWAQAFKAQNQAPQNFKIGRLQTVFTHVVNLVPTNTTQGFVYKGGLVGGKAWTYTVPGAATLASVCTAIAAIIGALSAGATASGASGTWVACTATVTGHLVAYAPGTGIKMLDVTADPGFAADIAAIDAYDDAWYGLAIQPKSRVYNEAAALFTEANGKIFMCQTADWNVADATVTSGDLGSDMIGLAYTRTWGLFHNYIGGTEWADAAWLASTLSFEPGNAITAFKSLAGISADVLSSGQKTGLTAKKFSRYMVQGGTPITYQGYTPSGRFIDVTRFVDWLRITIQLDAYAVFLNNIKVAYEDTGIALIEGSIRGSLKKGQTVPNNGLAISPDPTVTIPNAASQAPSDRALRKLNSIQYAAQLSGALQSLNISGTLSV
jgi:hypothetical protein